MQASSLDSHTEHGTSQIGSALDQAAQIVLRPATRSNGKASAMDKYQDWQRSGRIVRGREDIEVEGLGLGVRVGRFNSQGELDVSQLETDGTSVLDGGWAGRREGAHVSYRARLMTKDSTGWE